MAGKRENLDRDILQDGKKAASLTNNIGESMQRDLNSSGNIHTDRNEPCLTAPRNSKDGEVSNWISTAQFSSSESQRNIIDAGYENLQQSRQSFLNQSVTGQNLQAHQIQEPAPRDHNQNRPATQASQELIGVIPPREIDTRPPDGEADGVANYRRMAVCQETDDAQFQRTKMRVYMKRF